jgi:hypothetical protein
MSTAIDFFRMHQHETIQQLTTHFENSTKLMSAISTKYNIPLTELYEMLHSLYNRPVKSDDDVTVASSSTSTTTIHSMSKPQLIQMCRDRKISYTNKTKQALIELLIKSKGSVEITNLANKTVVRMNEYGNYEHRPTGLVFNSASIVYGKQVEAVVVPLTSEDIEVCKQHNFKYAIPESLDAHAETGAVQTDEDTLNKIVQKDQQADSSDDEPSDHEA